MLRSADSSGVFMEGNGHRDSHFLTKLSDSSFNPLRFWDGMLRSAFPIHLFLRNPPVPLVSYCFLLLSTSFYKANESRGGAVLLSVCGCQGLTNIWINSVRSKRFYRFNMIRICAWIYSGTIVDECGWVFCDCWSVIGALWPLQVMPVLSWQLFRSGRLRHLCSRTTQNCKNAGLER